MDIRKKQYTHKIRKNCVLFLPIIVRIQNILHFLLEVVEIQCKVIFMGTDKIFFVKTVKKSCFYKRNFVNRGIFLEKKSFFCTKCKNIIITISVKNNIEL